MSKSIYDLVAFQRALDVVTTVYEVTAAFPQAELYGLTSQLRRAAVRACVALPKARADSPGANGGNS